MNCMHGYVYSYIKAIIIISYVAIDGQPVHNLTKSHARIPRCIHTYGIHLQVQDDIQLSRVISVHAHYAKGSGSLMISGNPGIPLWL